MKAFFKLILCFGFVLSLSAQESSSLNRTVSPSIEFTPTENEITVRFSVFNKEQVNKSIRYQAVVVTKTKDNEIVDRIEKTEDQVLNNGEFIDLGTINASLVNADNIVGFLLIYEDDQIVGQEVVDAQKTDLLSSISTLNTTVARSSDFEAALLRTLVIDETKTKRGRDFFSEFYLKFKANNVESTEVVKIREELAIANNTLIKVIAGDDIIFQFFLSPRFNFIEEATNQTVITLNQYFQQQNRLKDETFKYE